MKKIVVIVFCLLQLISSFVYANDKSIEDLLISASKGNKEAYYNLGTIYLEGELVQRNISIAKDYYIQGAVLGNSDCFFALGRLYQDDSYGKDIEKSAKYTSLGCEKGYLLGC